MTDYVLITNYTNDLGNIYTKLEIDTNIYTKQQIDSLLLWINSGGTIDLWLYETIQNVNDKLLLYYKKWDFFIPHLPDLNAFKCSSTVDPIEDIAPIPVMNIFCILLFCSV